MRLTVHRHKYAKPVNLSSMKIPVNDMGSKCPKCGRTVPEDSVYCPYCSFGLKPSARTGFVPVGGTLFMLATICSLIISVLSINALQNIYHWYPQHVAQSWYFYDQLFTVFAIAQLFSGMLATALTLSRRRHKLAIIAAAICTLSGGGIFITSIIVPLAEPWNSFLLYFLPVFLAPLVGTALVFSRRREFKD